MGEAGRAAVHRALEGPDAEPLRSLLAAAAQ